jgi:hypothetical protein
MRVRFFGLVTQRCEVRGGIITVIDLKNLSY